MGDMVVASEMLEGTRKVLDVMGMECRSSIAKDIDGKEYPVLLMEYRDIPIALIDWHSSVVIRVEIKITDDLRQQIRALDQYDFEDLIAAIDMELNLGRCSHDLSLDGDDLSLITIEQKLLIYADRPETIQRLLDGINEVTNTFRRVVLMLYSMLQIPEEEEIVERSSPSGMYG